LKVIVNEQEIDVALPVGAAQELFDAINENPEWHGKVISRITADDLPIDVPRADEPFPPPMIHAQEFRITLENPVDLLRRSLADGDTLLARIADQCETVATSFRDGKNNAGAQALVGVLEKIGLFMDYVAEILHFVNVTFDGFAGDAATQALLQRTLALSKDMLANQKKHDLVTLADLIEFELKPLIDDWRAFFDGPEFATEN